MATETPGEGAEERVDFEGVLRHIQGLLGKDVSVWLRGPGAAATAVRTDGQLVRGRDVVEEAGVDVPSPYRGSITFEVEPRGGFSLSPHDFGESLWSETPLSGGRIGETLSVRLRDGGTLEIHGPGWVGTEGSGGT